MASQGVSASSARTVSTGYGRLNEALQGGFLSGSAVILCAPAGDETPLLVRKFLMSTGEEGLLVSRSLSAAQAISQVESDHLKSLICSDKPVPPAKNIIPGKSIENLTELNLQLFEVIGSDGPKRLVLDILSDILLRHKSLQTRKWLTELLERMRRKGITTLTVLNPYMHSAEDVQAVVDLFDGNLEVSEKSVQGSLKKVLQVKWMHGIEISEKEIPLDDLALVGESNVEMPMPAARQSGVPREPRWETPLVSRASELSRLRTIFDEAAGGKPCVVALQGEPGVGKSRLMRELAVYAENKGAVVLSAAASEGGPPYGPWVELARQFVARSPAELLRRLLGTYTPEFARLVPDIAAKLGTIPPSKPLGEQQDKTRLFEAVTRFLLAISSESPLFLLFDDMQFSDQSSLELLEYFTKSLGSSPVLITCSCPPETEIGTETPLSLTLMRLNKQRLLETVPVKNLNPEETVELMNHIFGEKNVSPEFTTLIFQRTGGNPFFVEEVLRSLVQDGTIYRTEKGWDRKPIQELAIPNSVKTALKTRLDKLDADALKVLELAAVIGAEFDFGILQAVSGLDEDKLVQELEEVNSQGLVVDVPHEKSKMKFTDNRIREVLLDDLMQIKRTRYHKKIADAMEKLYADHIERQATYIAYHFVEGGDAERGIKYSIIAGDRSREIHAYEQAIKEYRHALELIELEERNKQERAPILEKLIACYGLVGQLEKSAECYEQSLAIYQKVNDNVGCTRVCLAFSQAIEDVKGEPGSAEINKVLREGLKYIEKAPDSPQVASTYFKLAWNLGIMDQYEESNVWCDRAREIGEKTNNHGAVAGALMLKGCSLFDAGRIDEGTPILEQALDLARKIDDPYIERTSAFNLSIYTYPRNLTKARELATRSLEIALQTNMTIWEARAKWLMAVVDWLRGDWPTALDEIQRAASLFERMRGGGTIGALDTAGRQGLFLLSLGQYDEAERILEKVQQTIRQISKITLHVETNLPLGLLRLEQGREGEAVAILEDSVKAFEKAEFTTEPLLHIETLLHLTEAYARLGQVEKAKGSSDWAKRLAETLKSDAGLALASQAEAKLHRMSGDLKAAEEVYLRSLLLWEKAGWPYYRAKALVEYSEILAKSSPEESRKRLGAAVEIFKKLGAKRNLEKAEAALNTL